MNYLLEEFYRKIINFLSPREREVLNKRYGLEGRVLSLRQLGRELGVSYERIRQIENKLQKILLKNQEEPIVQEVKKNILEKIKKEGGVVLEEELSYLFGIEEKYVGLVKLFLDAFDDFIRIEKKERLLMGWNILGLSTADILNILNLLKEFLEKKGKPLKFEELFNYLKENTDVIEKYSLGQKELKSLLKFSRDIKKNILGEYGFVFWREIQPKNISEKIFLIFKKYQKPLHFSEIKKLIEQENFDRKRVTMQAVHNELVKNPNFILVGRGIYALKEWGYIEGTVADIIKKLLRESPRALSKEEILQEVLKVKKVSPKTILVNLYKNPEFIQIQEGYYILKDNKND